jgi:hypothetical protein
VILVALVLTTCILLFSFNDIKGNDNNIDSGTSVNNVEDDDINEYLLQQFSFDTSKTQKENISYAKTVMEAEQEYVAQKFNKIKTNNAISFSDDEVYHSIAFDAEGNEHRDIVYFYNSPGERYPTLNDEIKFSYTYHYKDNAQKADIDKIVNDIEHVFGKMSNVNEFKKILNNRLKQMSYTTGLTEIDTFQTASGVTIQLLTFSMDDNQEFNANITGDKYIEITGEYTVII